MAVRQTIDFRHPIHFTGSSALNRGEVPL